MHKTGLFKHITGAFFVLFLMAGCSTGPLTNLEATGTASIQAGSIDVELARSFTVNFSVPVDTRTVTTQSFFIVPVEDAAANRVKAADSFGLCVASNQVAASVACESSTTCTLTPTSSLEPEADYVICLDGTIATQDVERYGFVEAFSLQFTTVAASSGGNDPEEELFYPVGGSISGLSGTVILQNNAGNNLTLTSNGSFTFASEIADGSSYAVTVLTQPDTQTCSVSNGSGVIAGAAITTVSITCSTNTYPVSGVISGLTGTVVLQNNSGDNLSLSSNGDFDFATEVADGSSYAVTVLTQPDMQTCTVSNGSGTIDGAAITNVGVACSTNTYSVGGTISGLSGTVVLQNNLDDDLTLNSNGSFTFATAIDDGENYAVTVLTQPDIQTCTVSLGSGTIDGAAINNVSVTCSTNTYSVGGSVSGLSGTVVLQNNSGDDLSLNANGDFDFVTEVADGSGYAVTVLTQPVGQTCTASNHTGTISSAPVTNVAVSCSTNSYSVGGSVSGLSGTVVLQNNGGDELSLSSNGDFDFVTELAHGASYSVTVHDQPVGQVCTISNNAGTINGADVTNVTVTCENMLVTFEAYLKAPNTTNLDFLGIPTVIDGDTIAAAAYNEDSTTTAIINGSDLSATNNSGNATGAVYVFKRTGSTWVHEAYLKAPNAGTAADYFGYGLDVSGDTLVAGSYYEDSNTTAIIHGSDLSSTNDSGSNSGAAYVFTRSGSTWTHQAYLKAQNRSNEDLFGEAVAIDGDTIVVGAHGEASTTTAIINGSDYSATNNTGYVVGAAYVFKRNAGVWTREAYLKAPNAEGSDCFAYRLALDGDTIAVAAHGEASTTTAIINGSNLSSTNNSGSLNGAVYIFKRSGSTWIHEAYLKAPNTTNGDWFGQSLAISGDTVVVGAHQEDSSTTAIINGADLSSTNNTGSNTGAAYVFTRSGSTWSHEAYLKAPNAANADQFGHAVDVYDNLIAVSAWLENSNTKTIIHGSDLSAANNSGAENGAVYLYQRSGGLWRHVAYLKAPNSDNYDNLGHYNVAVSSNTVVVSAYGESSTTTAIIHGSTLTSTNNSGNDNGAVYVFRINAD